LDQSKIGTTRKNITMAGLTDDQVKLVKANWNAVKPIKETAADLFYDKLFELDPSIRSMFKEDISIQKKTLMATISFCGATLNHPEKFIPAVQELGRRHAGYGVTDKQPLAQHCCGHSNRDWAKSGHQKRKQPGLKSTEYFPRQYSRPPRRLHKLAAYIDKKERKEGDARASPSFVSAFLHTDK
jgi:hypothetical protein